jgi:hypothetical protein
MFNGGAFTLAGEVVPFSNFLDSPKPLDIAWPPKGRDPRHSTSPSRAAMSVTSMQDFRIGSNWQQCRREDLQKHPGGEEEKEHFVPR